LLELLRKIGKMDQLNMQEVINNSRLQRKQNKDSFEKKLIKLSRRRNELWDEILNLPLIELEQPYQRGYKRYFVLKNDIAHGDKEHFYQNILDKINTIQYHSDEKFQTKKRRKRKRVYVDKPQFLKNLTEYEWSKNPKMILTDQERACFELKDVYYHQFKRIQKEYVFSQPWRFRLTVEPNMITHIRQIDNELEKELKYINNYMDAHNLNVKLDKMFGRKNTYKSYHRSWDLAPRVKREDFKEKAKSPSE
jgi:hypothetical protein